MKFAESLRKLRIDRGLTIQELADKSGFSKRTIINWEQGTSLPRRQDTYTKLAQVFDIPVEELLTAENQFLVVASEKYGNRGMKQAMEMAQEISGMFAGGDLSEEDKQAVFNALQEAFFMAKLDNKKYTPRKYRKGADSTD